MGGLSGASKDLAGGAMAPPSVFLLPSHPAHGHLETHYLWVWTLVRKNVFLAPPGKIKIGAGG